jgi:8-oxo-dGTP pyrophosphatase MutT (NUDIX family)
VLFNKELGIQELNKNQVKINYREAVRGIIIQNNKILMVHSNKVDYKFPGGGVNEKENYIDALKREVEEETGYLVNEVKDKIGVIIERNLDEYEEDSIFEMISYYYVCNVSDKQTHQRLDDYEAELDFCPIWINLDDAILQNEDAIKQENKNHWIYRETYVLKKLKDNILGGCSEN